MKQLLSKLSFAALLVASITMIVPAAASAHTVAKGTAECKIVNGKPTIAAQWEFQRFGGNNPVQSTRGTIWVDGAKVRDIKSSDIKWTWAPDGIADGVLNVDLPSTAGERTIRARFEWDYENDGNYDNKDAWGPKPPNDITTVKCPSAPKPPEPEPEADPKIELDKSGPAEAAAGSKVTYTFKATNTGNTVLDNVALKDAKCESAPVRVSPNETDKVFNPGDSWFYTCTVTAPAGPATVDNTAEVCSSYKPPTGPVQTGICDSDTHTFKVPAPSGQKPGEQKPSTTTPGTQPSGTQPSGTAPQTAIPGRAAMRGPSGCVAKRFRARVTGRSIAGVTWYVDGRRVKVDRKVRASYGLNVRPARLGYGRHRIVARVEFSRKSGTATRRLPLTFRRCASGSVAPRFAG